MELEFKPDFEQTRRQWQKFWDGQPLDRPLLNVIVPKDTGKPEVGKPYPIRPDAEIGPVIEQTLTWAATHEFLGDSFPFLMMEFGPEHFATFLGAEMRYDGGTVWVLPFVEDWDDVEIRLNRESFYWQRTVEFIRALRARCDGRVLINAPVLSAGLDALSAIRGTERLLMDLVDRPERVARAQEGVRRVYHEVVEVLAAELAWDRFGSANWNGMYHPGRINTIQCDFSCMISPRMFREVELPSLEHQAAHYDAVTYHLDGPDAVKHLDTICAVPGIKVIQYMPGPQGRPTENETVFREIDSRGKGVIRDALPGDAHRLWKESRTKRLILTVNFNSRAEAERFIASFDHG